MAKKKSGLGRGLNSLLGESFGETGFGQPYSTSPQNEQVEQTVTKSEPSQTVDSTTETIPNEYIETIQPDSEGNDKLKNTGPFDEQEEFLDKVAVAATDSTKPVPYIEENDHIEIKGVVSRERVNNNEYEASLDDIYPNPDQPRTSFKSEEIEELAASIEKEGLLQPILVRKVGDKFQIIAGERRWQACKQLGMEKVPIRIKDANDDKAIELALIENIQRSDLNPIEEAYGYKRLMERQGMTQTEVAQAVSKGRSTIANALRLLELPEDAQQLLYEEKITAGHARAILSVQTMAGRKKLTEKLIEEKLSVREAENLARLFNGQVKAAAAKAKSNPVPDYFKKAARILKNQLGTNVRVKSVKGKNKVEIEFKDYEDLQRIFKSLVPDEVEGNVE